MERASLLARFATQKGRIIGQAAKPRLFKPDKELELSVFRIAGLPNEDIQEIGVEAVRKHRTAHTLYGWAEVSAQDVHDTGLDIEHDDSPPGHSTITGWPRDPDRLRQLQVDLALKARPVCLSKPIEVPDDLDIR